MLEAALSEALNRKDTKACLELGRLSEQLQISMSPRSFELLGQARQLEKDAPPRGSSSEGEVTRAGKSNASAIRERILSSGRAGDLSGAVEAFEQAQGEGSKASAALHNSIIEACAECKDFAAATTYLAKAQALGVADAASFCVVVRGLLGAGEEAAAR